MARRLTLEEIKIKLKNINPNIIILSTKYVNNSTKLKCKCLIDGHEWEAAWNNLNTGYGCPKCGIKSCHDKQRLTLDYVKETLFQINPNIEIVSDIYRNANEKLNCRCLIDGYEWGATWGHLKSGRGCPKCGGHIRLTMNDIKAKLKELNPNIEIISDEYINNQEKLTCRCLIDGFIWDVNWAHLSFGTGCPKCSKRYTPTMEEFIDEIKEINPNVKILSETYEGCNTKIHCRCLIDGNEWSVIPSSLKRGTQCPVCALRNKTGESSALWKGGITPLQNHLRLVILPWKKDSRRASNYKCVITGERFGAIHHLYGFDLIFQETMESVDLPVYENIGKYTEEELEKIDKTCLDLHYKYGLGICLKKTIHDEFHFEYGRGGNLPEQFEKFLKEKEMVRIA